MSKLDVKLVEKMYSDYGQELTPERLDYITNQFSNNNDFSNSFLKKYDPEKAVSSTEVEKKNPVSTITSEETPSESPIQEPKKNTLSVGGNPVQTGASASSAGKGKSIFGDPVSTFQEGLISDKTAKDKEKPKKKIVSIKKKEEELPFLKDIDRSSLKMELDGSIKKDLSGNVISIPKSKDAQEIVGDIQNRNKDIELIKQTGINEDIKKKQEQGIAPPTSELIKAGAVDLELSTGDGGVSEFLRAKSFEEKIAQQSKTPIEKAKESNKSLKINYDNFIKSRDLDLENPYAYYSKIKDGNLEIKELYGDNPIVNEIDFDGFLRKNGYLYDFKEELKSGFYTKDGAASNSEYNEELLKEKKLVDYFKLYLEDRVQRDFDKNSALYLKKNPNATIEEIEKNVEKKSIDQKLFDSYIYSNFPAYNKATSERKEKEAKEYKEYKENKGEFFSWQTGRNILKGIDNTLFKRVNEVSSTVYDLIGFEGISKKLRYKAEEVAFLNPQDRNISYVSGKKVSFGGNEYLVDSQGNIYDYEIKKRVTDLFDKDAYKSLIDQSKKGEDDYMFSWSGSTIQTTNVVADLGLQVLVTRGFSGASSLMGRGLTKEGLSMLKNIPLSKEMAASGAAQTFLGYSDGLESTLVAAKNYGIPDNEAKELANDAAMKMAGVYLLTSGISPQTKAAFNSTKNKVISEAMEAYAKNGRKGYLLAMDKGMSKLMEFGKEGTKETVQETIQQGAATYGVNKSINKKAGKKILQEEMTGDQIISMIPSTFVAGGIPVMIRMGSNIFSRKDYLSNLDTASNNVDLSNKRLGELLQSNAITQDEYNKSKEDLRVYSQNKNKIPKDTSAEIVLDVARGLDEISKLESQKQSLDKAFHPDIDKKIEAKRNEVKQLYSDQKTQEENEQTKLKIEAASILKKEALDSGIKEEDINISSDLINKKAKELYNQKTQQTNEEVTGQTNTEEKPTGINAEQTISATQQKDGVQLQPQEEVVEEPRIKDSQIPLKRETFEYEENKGNIVTVEVTTNKDGSRAIQTKEDGVITGVERVSKDNSLSTEEYVTKAYGDIIGEPMVEQGNDIMAPAMKEKLTPKQKAELGIEDQQKYKNTNVKKEVDNLRKAEIKELTENVDNPDNFITDGKVDANKIAESDNAKAKEIYAKYDKLLKPLLNNIKTQEVVVEKPIEERQKEAESKIKRKDLFIGVGEFSTELGGSDKAAVPVSHNENNGIEIVEYAHPDTGSIDVIVTGKSENDFVGFYRIYENGKPTNKWSSKFENQSRNKEDFKTMISGVQELLPKGHQYTEKTSISTDGLRVWSQQLDKGYKLQYDESGNVVTSKVFINGDAIENVLGVDVNKGKFESIRATKEEFEAIKKALTPYMEKFGLGAENIKLGIGINVPGAKGLVTIDLPILIKSKTQGDAIQKQSTDEGLLQPEQSKMGLQEVEQGNAKQEVVAEQSKEKINKYVSKLESTKASDPDTYWSVSPVTVDDASKSAIIDTEDGAAAVKPDGDIVGVFKKPESKAKGVAQELLKKAVEAGGIKLDNFDGYLTKQYEKAGFRVVSKTPFNEEYAPEGWNKDKHGTPDVVAMVYDPKGELNIEEKTFNDKDTGYDDMIAYRDKLISDQATKFQKSKIEIDGSTVDLITEEMNSMPEEIAKFDIPSNLTTKEKTNIGSLTDRFNDKVKTIKDISELDGVPFIFTISDQLTSGKITNPFTGNTIDVKGGIGFNMTEGNEGNAWANTTEAEANNMLQRATDVYSKNKDLFDRLWSEGKVPNGHVPMAVIKMGQTSIKSNEALFRFASDTFKKRFSKAKRIAAKNGLLKDLKSAKDIDQDVIDFVAKQNTIDEVLDNIKKLSISKRPDITGFVFTGGIKLGAKTRPGRPKSNAGIALVGENKDDYKYVHLQTINNLISEPATASIPDSHIVSVVGVDVLNPSVTKVDHQNYPFGVKGQLIGVLENPVHAADVFPEMYSKSIYLQKENKAGVPTSPETAVRQSVAAGGAVANIKAFRGAKIATKMTDLQKLLGKLKLAFPSVTIVDTQEEFLKELDNPNVKRFVKDGDVVYGFTKNGKVFLNPEKANSNTAIHEYSHIWTGFLKENNPGLLKKGYDLLEGSSILNDKISEFGDNELARDEAMAELIANKGETIIEASIKSKFKNWLNAVFNYVKANFKSFDKMSATELQNLNLNQFVDGALSSLLGGKEVTSKEIKVIGVKFSKETNKQELSDTKKEIQEVFSAAKEALKIEKDKNKVINDLKNKVNAFVKVAIQDLKAGDIGNRAITSIASRVQSVTDQNFDEKLLEVNAILDNLYTNRDVNKAKADKKKALKNVMAGKVGKLDKRGDRAKVMASKIVNFALLNPTILKKVLDDANFGLYTDYISNLAERKDALSDTDLKSYDRLYDEIVAPYKKYTDKVNEIQGKIDTNIPLSDSEQAFVDKNKSDFYEKEDVAAEEEKDAEKKAKKEAEIAKKKDAIKGLLPMMPKVFEDSDAEKGSFEWKILSALTSLDESDVDAMPESILSNVTNALNSMINDDVVPTYAEDLYRYTVKNKAKNLFLETVAKAGKGGLYKTKAGRAALKVREILGNPFTTIRGLAKGDLDAELLEKRIKMFRFSAIDAALKIYGETPIFDGIASVLGKGMSNLASTEAKAEEGLLNAKKLIDKKSKNAQESYMKITYHLIDAMAKNNQGTKSDVSAMEYFESTVSDPNSKVRENKAALKVVQDFIAKVKANGGSVELTPEEATAANAIRIVLDENQVTAYEANLFQNANASPMIAEYFPVSNSVKSQTDNDLANMQSRFGINGVVSTKSGNLEEKTGKAHPIDMNPFTAAFSSIKNTAVQFNLRSEYLGISQGLQESINDAIKNGDQDSELFLNGIQKALNSEFDLIVNGSVFGSNNLMDNVFNAIDRTFYQVMLGSVISRSVDYTGNIIQLAALNPKLLVSGNKIIKDLKGELKSGESEFELLREFYKNAEASDINKMMSAKSATTERTEFLNKGINKGVLSKGLPFSNIFTKVKAKFVAPVDEKLSGINEGLISISDVKPYGISWNSIFRDTFLAETGSDVDVAKVARGDKKYLKDNADAIKRASNKANRESADLFGSTNPFEKQVGIMEVAAGKKNSRNPLSALVNRAKYFLSGFNIGANTSMTTAINTFVENKDPREARKALGGAIRVGMYRTAVAAVSGMIWSLFKGDDDDEDKLVKSFDKLADDDKFIKEMNNLFLDFPIRKDRDGNPVNLSMKDFEQYNKLRDKLLSNKDFKNAYDIYYKFINRNLFDEAVRLRANQINTSKEKVFKQNIEMFFDEIKGGFPKDDTQIIETLAILHSNEGAKLFTSEEVDGYILDIENHMSKIGFLDNRALRNANSQIDRMIINETALLLSDHRNQSAEDIIVKEGAQLLMGLMFPRSNNIIKGGYNYLAESANKMMIQSRRGERGYDLYKDMIFQPIVKTGLSDKSQGVVKEAIGVLNPALKDLLKKDNEDAATVSMLRYIKTIGTLGLNDFNKINSKMKNDEIYQKTNGKFKENIIKDIAKDKVDIIREVTDKEGIESDAKERGVYKSRVLPGIDSTEVKSKLPSYMDKKDLKINGRSIE
jgi:hypothetical protein